MKERQRQNQRNDTKIGEYQINFQFYCIQKAMSYFEFLQKKKKIQEISTKKFSYQCSAIKAAISYSRNIRTRKKNKLCKN